MYRFKGFTEKANTALNLAIEAAQELGHTYIGTEHIVLGLLREGTGVAASVLGARGVTAALYEEKIVEVESSGEFSRLTPEDFTPRAKTAMEMSLAEAAMMQHGYVGTEHILMAVLRDDSSVSVRLIVAWRPPGRTVRGYCESRGRPHGANDRRWRTARESPCG